MVRDDMLSRSSVVGDREGGADLLAQAMESGQEVVCVRCGALVSRKRWDVHRDVWCPKSGSLGNEEGSEEGGGGGGGGGGGDGDVGAGDADGDEFEDAIE